jgi:hypothetical protein
MRSYAEITLAATERGEAFVYTAGVLLSASSIKAARWESGILGQLVEQPG